MNAQWMSLDIEHKEEEQRFELDLAETGIAELKYKIIKNEPVDIIDFTHTFVPPEVRNRGLGRALVRRGLYFAEKEGYQVRGSCPFVESFLDDHSEYDALRA